MHTLKRLSARLRPNRNRKSPAEPSPVGQDPPLIRTILPTYAGELCATCLEFLAIIKTEPAERVPCPADGAELLELPPLFCPFCYLRWRVMPSEEREKLRGCREATIKVHPSSVSVVITINYLYPVGAGSYLMALGCQPCDWTMAKARSLSSSSDETFGLIKEWDEFCHNNHERCSRVTYSSSTTSSCPAGRILDLELKHPGLYENGSIRLINSQEVEHGAKYISVSHRWGAYRPYKLKKARLQSFQNGFHPRILAKTFTDAIDISRRLGVRYLWIDCLCIVQDDGDDWKTESAKMAQIYAGAWLNIAAVRAQDARDGCYADRESWDVSPLVIHTKFRQVPFHHFVLFDSQMHDTGVLESALMQRAWVQQEQFFSRRTLYYAQHQIYWRCQELTACETFIGGLPEYARGSTLFQEAYKIASLENNARIADPDLQRHLLNRWSSDKGVFTSYIHSDPSGNDSQRELIKAWKFNLALLGIWSSIVGRYSSCGLAFPTRDKLVAISGLARRCGNPDNYLAGLWRSTLPWQLLWRARGGQKARAYPRLEGPPSWSWASLHQSVFMHNHLGNQYHYFEDDRPLVDILQANTRLVGNESKPDPNPDPFGQVKGGGTVKLDGFMLKLKISDVLAMIANWGQCRTTLRDEWGRPLLRENWHHDVYCEDDFGGHTDNDYGHFLAVLHGRVHESWMNIETVQGLWLKPTGDRHGEYERRGSFVLPVASSELWPLDFEAQFDQKFRTEEYEQYEGEQSVGFADSLQTFHRYKISIV